VFALVEVKSTIARSSRFKYRSSLAQAFATSSPRETFVYAKVCPNNICSLMSISLVPVSSRYAEFDDITTHRSDPSRY
jgi:hypothetical protein